MFTKHDRRTARDRRHRRVRTRVEGSAARPRLAVYRSLRHIVVQIIDDATGSTLAAASTHEAEVSKGVSSKGSVNAAVAVGRAIAQRAKAQGINAVVFDRGGYLYHGRVKALADAAREAGLEF